MPPTTLNSEEPVEVKVLDDERSSTPYRQGPLQCLTYLLLFPLACPLQAV